MNVFTAVLSWDSRSVGRLYKSSLPMTIVICHAKFGNSAMSASNGVILHTAWYREEKN